MAQEREKAQDDEDFERAWDSFIARWATTRERKQGLVAEKQRAQARMANT